MKIVIWATWLAMIVTPAIAQEKRETGGHEHGVGRLNMAFEASSIAIELSVSGADIVGFEHAAESAEDRARIEDATALLARPLDLFAFPQPAGCSVTEAEARLVTEGDAHGHGHKGRAGDGKHEHGTGHAEFHAEYLLTCSEPQAIDRIEFPYFEKFPNARELRVQMVSDKGSETFGVERDRPTVELRGRI